MVVFEVAEERREKKKKKKGCMIPSKEDMICHKVAWLCGKGEDAG